MRISILVLSLAILSASATSLQAATEADYTTAYAAAEAANKEAGALRNQWTTTAATLAAAKKAAGYYSPDEPTQRDFVGRSLDKY